MSGECVSGDTMITVAPKAGYAAATGETYQVNGKAVEAGKLNADGSDFIVVVAEVTDDNGNVKRLAKDNIYFTVEGEGRIIGDGDNIMGNPRIVEWGSAPVLIQATDKPGKITIKARSYYDGVYAPAAAELTIESVAPTLPACYTDKPTATVNKPVRTTGETKQTMTDEERQRTLEEVNKQQAEFGVQ